MEEKYQKVPNSKNGVYGDKYDEDEDSSSAEDEDDDGFLATEALDAEISATLQAIKSKDPRVYDEKITFYAPIEEDEEAVVSKKEERPMYLRDYHRENLLTGGITGVEDADNVPPRTFAQEQEDLKNSIVREMHAAADAENSPGEEDDDQAFLVPKSKPTKSHSNVHPSRKSKIEVDVTIADKDPETFLSNFIAARAWVPGEGTRFQPMESDDDEEEERAEKFEAAYNLRFENPEGSNEILKSYARDVVAAKSVRRDEPKGRKKQREIERQNKEEEKRQREGERARLRSLKIEQLSEKMQKIKKAAGIKGKTLKDEEWMKFLDEGWDDGTWEAEMRKRFGDEYYAEQELDSQSEDDAGEVQRSKKKKPKKPVWDDDIDIKDIVPEFEESTTNPPFTLSDSEADSDEKRSSIKPKTSKSHKLDKLAARKASRQERRKIEELVDASLPLHEASIPKSASRFRYRETSPTSFGLTPRDILFASDAALNQFAGLKKMATFRDDEKKRKDRKRLGKKARLREWRRETFGNEEGPAVVVGGVDGPGDGAGDTPETVAKNGEGATKKKKRSRKPKIAHVAAV